MVYFYRLLLAFIHLSSFNVLAFHGMSTSVHAISHNRYSRAHSLGDNYKFHPREGWITINASRLQNEYGPHKQIVGNTPSQYRSKHHTDQGLSGKLGNAISGLWDGIKAVGPSLKVIITWYTGHDLKNPSCWAKANWNPTDESFVCALTLLDWLDRPECFDFLELCSSPKKCVFVRVVDTCAGCAPGSHHVDLTRAAFGQLADFDQGKLIVNARKAVFGLRFEWHVDLWGPKHKG